MLHRNLMIEALDMVLAQGVQDYVLPDAVASQATILAGGKED
jgi:hypothetical protein